MITPLGFLAYMALLLVAYMVIGYALTRALNPAPYRRRATLVITDDRGRAHEQSEVAP